MDNDTLLVMNDIEKTFFGVKVLDKVNFDLKAGEIHALVGENGAGKSTLMKILSGSYQSDSGKIFIDGKQVHFKSPANALENGVGIVHQELMLAPHLNVAENIFLGREPKTKIGTIDWHQIYEKSKVLLEELNIRIDVKMRIEELTVAKRQLIEIVKILSLNPKILILDEPTSSLSDVDINLLFEKIKVLKSRRIGIIYISHKLNEIKSIADRVTVLRDGKYIETFLKHQIDIDQIINRMVGRKDSAIIKRDRKSLPGERILEVRNLTNRKIRNISFSLNKGEILGFAGLNGAGRSETMRALFGIDPIEKGTIIIRGINCKISHPNRAILEGIGFAPEDRREQALFLEKDVLTNITSVVLGKSSKLVRSLKNERNIATNFTEKLNIQTPSIFQIIKRLSGGNQQKVVISRWLSINPDILILDEPTRGIDVGAKREIYEILSSMVEKGVAVIFISEEMPELLALADRIIVMHEGKIMGELTYQEATQEKIMILATGNHIVERNENI